MHKFIVLFLFLPAVLPAQKAAGRWTVSADFYGTPILFSLDLKQEGDSLTGTFGGDQLQGSVSSGALHFVAKDEQGGTEQVTGTIQGETITGTVVFTGSGDAAH
jgi:amidase